MDGVDGIKTLSGFIAYDVLDSFWIGRKFFVTKAMNLYFVLFHRSDDLNSFYFIHFVFFDHIFLNEFLDGSYVSFDIFI